MRERPLHLRAEEWPHRQAQGAGRGGCTPLRRGDDLAHRTLIVFRENSDGVDVELELLLGGVDLGEAAAEGGQGSLRAQGLQVGAAVAGAAGRELRQEGPAGGRHPVPCVDLQDGEARLEQSGAVPLNVSGNMVLKYSPPLGGSRRGILCPGRLPVARLLALAIVNEKGHISSGSKNSHYICEEEKKKAVQQSSSRITLHRTVLSVRH